MTTEALSKPSLVDINRPDEGLVQMLEENLARAKAGEIVAGAIVFVFRGGSTYTQWIGGKMHCHELISGASNLSFRMNKAFDDAL